MMQWQEVHVCSGHWAFVTLADELGHAANMRAGSVGRARAELMMYLVKLQMPTATDRDIEDRWSASDEYFNMTNPPRLGAIPPVRATLGRHACGSRHP